MLQVSVVLPTFNRLDRLQRVLGALAQQTFPRGDFEVIVISDGSTDGTDRYLKSAHTPYQLRAVFQSNHGVAVARNQGVAVASGALVLFIDDDVAPAPDLMVEHVHTHQQHDGKTVVLGPMLTPAGFDMQPWVQWEQAMLVKQYDDMERGRWQPTARQFYTGNTSLARHHVVEAGGFDPSFRRAEDVELAYRLAKRGLHFVFNPRAIGYHYAERSFESWLKIAYTYGRNDVIFTRDKGEDWLLPTVLYEYHGRNRMIHRLVHFGLDRRRASAAMIAALKLAALAGCRLRVKSAARMAYSGMFNLKYYQGIADELGGRRAFWQAVASSTTAIGPPV